MEKEERKALKRIRNQCYHLIADLYSKHEKLGLNHDLGHDDECVHCRKFHVLQEMIRERKEELRADNQRSGEEIVTEARYRVSEKDIEFMKNLHMRGFTKAAIAERLNISLSTVYRKLPKVNIVDE